MAKLISIIAILLIGSLQYKLWVGAGSLPSVNLLKQNVEQIEAVNQHQISLNNMLKAEILDLKQRLDAIEERARFDLGLIKQDEIFYQVAEPTE